MTHTNTTHKNKALHFLRTQSIANYIKTYIFGQWSINNELIRYLEVGWSIMGMIRQFIPLPRLIKTKV